MAPKYVRFQHLRRVDFLGSDEDGGLVTVSRNGDSIVVTSPFGVRLVLGPNDRLGYDEGRIWMASPQDQGDPLLNFLSRLNLSPDLVVDDDEVVYSPHHQRRLVAGEFRETEGSAGTRVIHGGDAVVVLHRSDRIPPYIDKIVVRSRDEQEREDLLSWLREAMISRGYWQEHSNRMAHAYYLARSICFKTGMTWTHPGLFQRGRSFTSCRGKLYVICAYRSMEGGTITPDREWIPHIMEVRDDYNRHVCLAEALVTRMLLDWARSVGALNICNLCGSPLLPDKETHGCSAGCF